MIRPQNTRYFDILINGVGRILYKEVNGNARTLKFSESSLIRHGFFCAQWRLALIFRAIPKNSDIFQNCP